MKNSLLYSLLYLPVVSYLIWIYFSKPPHSGIHINEIIIGILLLALALIGTLIIKKGIFNR